MFFGTANAYTQANVNQLILKTKNNDYNSKH